MLESPLQMVVVCTAGNNNNGYHFMFLETKPTCKFLYNHTQVLVKRFILSVQLETKVTKVEKINYIVR